jgi:hypothetical protein
MKKTTENNLQLYIKIINLLLFFVIILFKNPTNKYISALVCFQAYLYKLIFVCLNTICAVFMTLYFALNIIQIYFRACLFSSSLDKYNLSLLEYNMRGVYDLIFCVKYNTNIFPRLFVFKQFR